MKTKISSLPVGYIVCSAGPLVAILLGMRHLGWMVFLWAFFAWVLIYRPLLDYWRLRSLGVLSDKERDSIWSKTIFTNIRYKYFLPLYFGISKRTSA